MRTAVLFMTVMVGTLDCNGSQSGPDACVAAGGQCLSGIFSNCAAKGTQDCNPDRNPGGAVCCLAFLDAGGDAMANAADAAPDGGDDVAPGRDGAPAQTE